MTTRRKIVATGKRMEKELRRLGKNLDAMAVKARAAERKARARYAGQLAALKRKQQQAKRALAHLRRQSAAAAPPLKAGIRRAWRNLDSAVRAAAKRFRQTS